jgi:hypothetical protein
MLSNGFASIFLPQVSRGKAAVDHRGRCRALQGGGHQEVQEHPQSKLAFAHR